MARRCWLGAFCLAFIATLTACGGGGSETVAEGPDDWRAEVKVLRAGVKGSEEDPAVLRRWNRLKANLEEATGVPVEFYEASDYNGIIQAMASGQIELASVGAGSFSNLHAQIGDMAQPLFAKEDSQGVRGYYSSIIVRADSDYHSIEDLRGQSLAFVDFNSTSGYIFPRYKMREQDVDPDTFFGELAMAGGHTQAVMALANGQFDAVVSMANGGSPEQGFVGGSFRRMARRGVIDATEFREIWYAGPLPNGTYVMRKDSPQALRDLVAGLMISLAYEDPEAFQDIGRTPGSVYNAVDLEFYREMIDIRNQEIRQHRERFARRAD